jgi:hypothetical protein
MVVVVAGFATLRRVASGAALDVAGASIVAASTGVVRGFMTADGLPPASM